MDLFNSRRAEYSPMLSGDEDEQLYFTSTRNQAQGDEYSGITGAKNADIFLSQKDDKGKWSKPQTIDSELNSTMDEGACCFSPDGKSMYLTICKTDPNYPRYATIAVSNRSDASWSKPTELTLSKDTLSSFAHPAVSPDGQWLYFVSDMPGGLGGFDIWRCQIHGNEVGSLENLGEPVNTPGDEMFPTFRPNGDLYFSSDGHPGLGGLDIFIAKSKDKDLFTTTETTKTTLSASGGGALASGEEKKLSKLSELSYKIEHPGFPLNSQGDDFGMTFEGKRNQGYFCSNRGDTRGYDHIYSFFNPEIVQTVKGWVYEQDGYELPAAQVYMVGNDGTNLKLSVRGDGSFTQEIKPNVDYVLLATCKGFLNHQEQLRVDPVTKSEEYVLQFPLANISAPVLIENIFYDFDKATLRPESTTALDELVRLLNENPNITIELSAHTDYKGSDEYNEGLSQRRAESVVNYLIEHGIPSDRLTPRGYGDITVDNSELDDMVLIKSDGFPTYNFANVVDDHLMEITHVVRGQEYLSSSPKYNRLYEAFGWDVPVYVHCPTITNEQHQKLSKRSGHASFEDLIEQGFVTEAVVNFVALLGWSPEEEREIFSLEELAKAFNYKRISKSPAVFDMVKLRWMNGEYLKAMDPERFYTLAEPYLKKYVTAPLDLRKIAEMVRTRIEIFPDIEEMVDFFNAVPEYDAELYVNKKSKSTKESAAKVLSDVLPLLEKVDDAAAGDAAVSGWNGAALFELLKAYAAEQGFKVNLVMWAVRIALSGKAMTPAGATDILDVLGKEESLKRIRAGIEKLG